MKEKILDFIGFGKKDKYIKDFFYAANMRASIYMSIVIIVIELWMIIRLAYRQINGIDVRTPDYYISHYLDYALLLSIGTAMIIFAIRFVIGKKTPRLLGYALKWAFMIICIYFGIQISLADYSRGEQILSFLTMELFAACLLTWAPYMSFLIISISYGVFFFCIENMPAYNTGLVGTTDATKINLIIMWIATLMCSLSNYSRTISQARKDDNLEKLNSHLEKVSLNDEMTGIHNMVYFRDEATKLMNYVTTDKSGLIFLFFDIENFQSYNEKYGFHEGNDFLKRFAAVMNDTFRGSLCARFSDDHFVVLTKYDGSLEPVRRVSDYITENQGDVHLQLKCGGYRPEDTENDPSLACDRARFACNSIKKHYHHNFRMYDEVLDKKFRQKHYIVNNIDNAVSGGWIKVFYQPIISVSSGKVIGLEALARWDDPIYGMMPPAAFIDILEEYRQIYKLDCSIIDTVCEDLGIAIKNGYKIVPVSVNLSRLDFELCDVISYIDGAVKKNGIPKGYIDIEITESALNEQQDLLCKSIKALRDSGFRVWLDDFGSGYSSLNVIKDYQFDVMKIDMKFLNGFSENEKTRPILENIVELSHKLDMVPLSEGVETRDQLEFLRSIGCARVQGYLFSKPLPINELGSMIERGELVLEDRAET